MSQPEPASRKEEAVESVGSEGVPQSGQTDSAAPVSSSSGLRLNPNAAAFVPKGMSDGMSAAFYTPPFVPVFQQQGVTPMHDSRRKFVYDSRPRSLMSMPAYGFQSGNLYHVQQSAVFYPDAYYVQQQQQTPAASAAPEVQQIMLSQQLDFPELGASNNPKKSKSVPAQTTTTTASSISPTATEEEAKEKAPLTWAQRVSLSSAAKAVPVVPKAVPVVITATEEPASPELESAEEELSTSSFMEEVDSTSRRIYSVEFLLQFKDYCDPSIPVKELIPSHLYLQPEHEDESLSWRAASSGGRRGGKQRAPTKVSGVLLEPLKRAEHSWGALQQKLKTSSPEEDDKVERTIRGLLNKLTSDKYDKLKAQLFNETDVNLRTYNHISTLIRLLFEKATQQHHFIPLYADLCRDCRLWLATPEALTRFSAEVEVSAPDVYFRRSLNEHCQQAFDSFLLPDATEAPKAEGQSAEDQYVEEVKYRTKVWGNLKLIGQLIARRIISSRVAMNCIEELLAQGNNETLLEALAVFLTDVARVIDNPNWERHAQLEEVFVHLASIAHSTVRPPPVSSKCRFALQNLLDLRKANWNPAAVLKVAVSKPAPTQTASKSGSVSVSKAPQMTKPASQSSFQGWGKILPGVAKTQEESAKQCRSVLQEYRASRSVAETLEGLKDAMEGLEKEDKVAVLSHEQLCFALNADCKDHELLVNVISLAIPADIDPVDVVISFLDGPFADLKHDLPNVGSIVKSLILPAFKIDNPSPALAQRLGSL